MKAQHLFIVIGTALLFGCSPPDQQSTPSDKITHSAPDPAIVAKLQEIVEIRERLLQEQQRKFEAGLAEQDGAAEVALAEARIQLAREQGQSDAAIAELRKIVATHTRNLERAKARAAAGVQTPLDIERARVALLESEVQLQRELRRH